ncbi:hypothetical protein [Thermoanaerobacterium sp. DL9XJH110]|uniref:hypothetical protein n=1 Tax=Thermoanaerobacterium sp. DL9XJH110 TaxID=3386643 RepID=UPI003BB6C4F2
MRGFWNDPNGLTIDEFAALLVLPLFLFVGVKLAMAKDISSTQVDFFTVLTYPILAVVARQAVERIGWPSMEKRSASVLPATTYYQEPVATATYVPRSESDGDGEQPATVNSSNQPSI